MDVKFKYILKNNIDVKISGTVEVPNDEDADDAEFEIIFEKADGFPTPNLTVKHYGVEITATEDQQFEIDTLIRLFNEDFLFLQRISDNIENDKVIDLGEAYLVINEANFEK